MQIMVKIMSWGLVGMVSALPSYFSLRPTHWRNPSVRRVGFFFEHALMPQLPLRRKLLDELDDVDRSFKRARLSKYL